MESPEVANSARMVNPILTDDVLQSENDAAGNERRSSQKRLRAEFEHPAAVADPKVPDSPAVADSNAAPAAAAELEVSPAGSHSTKKLAARRSSPAAAPAAAACNQPQPAPALTVPSIQFDSTPEDTHPKEPTPPPPAAAAAAAAEAATQKASAARPGGSSRGTAAALQGKAGKARLQRARAPQMERRAAVNEPEVDMFKGELRHLLMERLGFNSSCGRDMTS